jgi:hypothetical protein
MWRVTPPGYVHEYEDTSAMRIVGMLPVNVGGQARVIADVRAPGRATDGLDRGN